MTKPSMPKKPSFEELRPPGNVETICGYAYENSDGEVRFFEEDMFTYNFSDEKVAKAFFDKWTPVYATSRALIKEFADYMCVPIEEVTVVPFLRDNNLTLEYRVLKKMDDEEFKKSKAAYDAELRRRDQAQLDFMRALKQYKLDLAEYELWEIKQKVMHAKDNPRN